MKAALKDAVDRIQQAGFSHIKVELEGDLGRDSSDECFECDGSGTEACTTCYGDGTIENESYDESNPFSEEFVECDDCDGEGSRTCDYCDGDGTRESEYYSESAAEDFILDQVSIGARDALNYGNFYEDGSVDSEFTFTLPIEKVEYVTEFIDAFQALADECKGMDAAGAGMHISVLPNGCNGNYPTRIYMDSAKLRNFSQQMTRLMPALFFTASATHQSRNLEYRFPRVSSGDKYSAIYTHGGTCLEYRVFETCYERPEAFFEYVQVIAKSLVFYSDVTARVPVLNKEFGFSDGYECARFFDTTEALQVLNAQIALLKPRDVTFKKMKRDRGVYDSIKQMRLKEREKARTLREDYKQYKKHWEHEKKKPLTEAEKREIDYRMLNGANYDEALSIVRNIDEELEGARDFVRRNMLPIKKSYAVAV